MKKIISMLLALLMLLALVSCGGSTAPETSVQEETTESAESATESAPSADPSVVNIGCTAALGTLNPLMMDGTFVNVYAMSLEFLPLVSMKDHDGTVDFEYMLADSITTEDNLTYTVHINDNAVWSDGTPVTAADLAYTMTRIASPLVMNYAMQFTAIVGTDDTTGWVEEGAETIEGLNVVDEKTLEITFKWETNMTSFLNGYAQYILTLPKHVLETIPEAELSSAAFFDAPTVVSGPYMVVDHDPDHYITYKANENYWMGKPQIENCNIKIVDPSQLLTGLKTGELNVVPPLLGTIPQEDYESVQALENVTADFGLAAATETIFLNCESIPDQKVRQAMQCAIDREAIITGLLGGNGQLMDGFCVPEGPYYNDALTPVSYDPEKAKTLLAEAGWDGSETYTMYINSGDKTLINACTMVAAYWEQVGIKVELVTVNLDTLMAQAGQPETDLLAVQYTYPVVDPSWDIDWLLSTWCHLPSESTSAALLNIWSSNDDAVLAENYGVIEAEAQENVPLICLYANGPLGAVSNDLQNAEAKTYGGINNIHDWSWAE